jgi:hypothetical protein
MFRRKPTPRPRNEPRSAVRLLLTPEEREAAVARAAASDAIVTEVLERRQRIYAEAAQPRVRLVVNSSGVSEAS